MAPATRSRTTGLSSPPLSENAETTQNLKIESEDSQPVPSVKEIAQPKTPKSVARKAKPKSTPAATETTVKDEVVSPVRKIAKPRTPRSVTKKVKSEPAVDAETLIKDEAAVAEETVTPARPKRKRAAKVEKTDDGDGWDVLPHGMGKNHNLDNVEDGDDEEKKPKKSRRSPAKKVAGDAPKKGRAKKHPYGLTPGISPFPDHIMPTPEACEEVHRILKAAHDPMDKVKPPKEIPPPSMYITGCGEVPDLLDAMLRTLLSAATTNSNSNSSIQGLAAKFGLRTVGLGAGSTNWDAVHAATYDDLFQAIRRGGLAKAKATNIKKILDIVYQRNVAIRDALLREKETGEPAEGLAERYENQAQKDAQLARFKETLLCLDYIFELSNDEAMDEMTKLPGIGVKTASCVILFNMQRPSFAVDTHVWRLCKWLGWVPEKATRDQTFSHGEVRIPDHLKYALHQLFIRHGKDCVRCQAATGTNSEEFINCVCPLEHLLKRTGKRKDSKAPKKSPAKKGAKGKKAAKEEESEEEDSPEEVHESADEDSELSELSDEEVDE